MTQNFYDLGHQHAYAGLEPDAKYTDQPYYMHGYNNGRLDFERYLGYVQDGHSRYQAQVMAGMRDPHGAIDE